MAACNVERLPNEVLLIIFSYLSNEDLALNVRNVCSRWRNIADSKVLWEEYEFYASDLEVENVILQLRNMPCLKSFCLWDNHIAEDAKRLTETLATYCKNLKVLEFPYTSMTAGMLQTLLSNSVELDKLVISTSFYNQQTTEVIGQFETLSTLVIAGECTDKLLNPHALRPIATGCPNLTSLCLENFNIPAEEVNFLLQHKANKLKDFSWLGPIYSSVLMTIAKCTELLSLKMSYFTIIDYYSQCNIRVPEMKSLEKMIYESSEIEYLPIILANTYKHLKILFIYNTKGHTNKYLQTILFNCVYLESLTLINLELEDSTFKNIRSQCLKHLEIQNCRGWSYCAILHIKLTCKNLQVFGVSHCKLSLETCSEILQLEHVETFHFVDCDIQHFDFKQIATCLPRLKRMHFDNCKFNSLQCEAINTLKLKRPRVTIKIL